MAEGDTIPPAKVEDRAQWTADYPSRQPRSGKSLLQIYAEVLASDTLQPVPFDDQMMINDRIIAAGEGERGEALHKLAKDWSLSDEELKDGPGGWERKVEELNVLASLLACGTGKKGKSPRVDFFLVCPSDPPRGLFLIFFFSPHSLFLSSSLSLFPSFSLTGLLHEPD